MWSRRRQRKIERMRQEESNRRAALEAGPGKPGPSGTIPQRVLNKKVPFRMRIIMEISRFWGRVRSG